MEGSIKKQRMSSMCGQHSFPRQDSTAAMEAATVAFM